MGKPDVVNQNLFKELNVCLTVKIFIKNMVCYRCQIVVKNELDKLGFKYSDVKIGEADLVDDLQAEDLERLDKELNKAGLQLLSCKKTILIEKIKNAIIELAHYSDDHIKVNLSDYLSEKLHYDYTYLANIFSEAKGITIEKFFLTHKIEKVKELILYNEYTISEIARKMNYSSVAHLSKQFKKITGITPTHFKMTKNNKRDTLESI